MADTDTPAADATPKKPARRRSTTPAKSAAAKSTASRSTQSDASAGSADGKKAKAPPKPRAAKRSTSTGTKRPANKSASAVKTATDKVGGKWGAAAIAGGLAAAGAAAAALLTLRGSSAKPGDPAQPQDGRNTGGDAHQPDGSDSSASFKAGIADENTVPDRN